MNKRTMDNVPKGIKLRHVNLALFLIVPVLVFISILSITRVRSIHGIIEKNNSSYLELQQSVEQMDEGSKYMSENVRAFVTTGERKYLDQYFEERDVSRRRDAAVQRFEETDYDNAKEHLREALNQSQGLEVTELYAMALYLIAEKQPLSEYPAALSNVQISAEDLAISSMRQTAKAQAIVYNSEYIEVRKKITGEVEACQEALVQDVLTQQLQRERVLDRLLSVQTGLIALIFLLIFGMLFLIRFLMLNPLNALHRHIQEQTVLPLEGAYELQYVSATYNDVYSENLQIRQKLDYEASHDALTGLQNRRRFDAKRAGKKDLTMIIIDVDYFKHFNDTYGHDVGDAVLKKVADALVHFFRQCDGIYRIGGDEFAIIMDNMDSSKRAQLEARFKELQQALRKTDDNLPGISISIGVALSDRENGSSNPLKDADVALYEIKAHGRNGFAFYHAA